MSLPYLIHETFITANLFATDKTLFFLKILFPLVAVTYAILWSDYILKNKIVKNICLVLATILCFLDIFCFFQYNTLFNSIIFQNIINTNIEEASEFLSANLTAKNGLLLAFFGGSLWIYKKIKTEIKIPKKTFFVMLIITLAVSVPIDGANVESFILNRIVNIGVLEAKYNNECYEAFKTMENQKINIKSKGNDIPFVVLILGESTAKSHMNIYGYERETTPNLNKKDIIVFENAETPETYTIGAVQKIFTQYNRKSQNQWFENLNIIDVFKVAEYKTYWLSNQENIGLYSSAQYILSKRCDYSKYVMKTNDDRTIYKNLDETLFPEIDKAIKDNHDKKFIVAHLHGTHYIYKERYSADFEKFKPKDDTKASKIISEYDNAILYNDYIISGIMEKFKNENAIVIYISDHGEDVFENGEDFYGHYQNGTKHMYEIPMLIYCTDKFKKTYRERYEEILKMKNEKFNTENIFQFLCEINSINLN